MTLENADRDKDVLKERIKAEVSYFEATVTPDSATVVYRGVSYPYRRSSENLMQAVPRFSSTPQQLSEAGLTSSHLAAFAERALEAMDKADDDTQIDRAA